MTSSSSSPNIHNHTVSLYIFMYSLSFFPLLMMDQNNKTELVFVPFSAVGQLAVTLELAKMMTLRDPRLSITIVIVKFPFASTPTPTSDSDSIRFLTLPAVEVAACGKLAHMFELMKAQVPMIRDAVRKLTRQGSAARLGGFVLDMFWTHMIDVAADEFGVPSYLFFTSGAAYLGFKLHLQFLHDNQGLDFDEFKHSDSELEVPSYANPVPGKVFPYLMFDKEGGGAEMFLHTARRYRLVQGIMVNTFLELESHAIRSFSDSTLPTVYPVGPLLNTRVESGCAVIMRWLDDQPPSSVIFLCFGSWGSFGGDQVKEIARGLEGSGHRFLWSLRQPPRTNKVGPPTDYADPKDVLPEGFLDRTAEFGMVIGWAPQKAVLAHASVGGFVSHCGWNSILESICFGVPVATWPLYAEQQLNAFEMVEELGLGVEIKMDYYRDGDCFVSGEEIEIGLRKLMNKEENEGRKTLEEMKKLAREVIKEGGSSHISLGRFIEDLHDDHGRAIMDPKARKLY